MRRYVSIRPSDPENVSDSGSTGAEPSVAKRRRVGVSIACNVCRRKKIRCDGQRPSCSNCDGNPGTCFYRNDSELSHESQLLLIEVIRLLNSVSVDEAVKRLRDLRKEIDASVIMATLRQDGDPSQKSSEASISGHQLGDPFRTQELAAQNPNAYLVLPDVDLEPLQEVNYQHFVQSTSDETEIESDQIEQQIELDPTLDLCDADLPN